MAIYIKDNVKTKWENLFELEITDNKLRKHVKNFLDLFEQSIFVANQKQNIQGQNINPMASGPLILDAIQRKLETVKNNKALSEKFQKAGLLKNGKFMISDHKEKFTGSVITGCNTQMVEIPATSVTIGTRINLGKDYLKKVQITGTNNKLHPVSVEAALSHELYHMAGGSPNEETSILFENAISSGLGGPLRIKEGIKIGSGKNYKSLIAANFPKEKWSNLPKENELENSTTIIGQINQDGSRTDIAPE